MAKTATLTVQQWGNSLAVRIPAAVARSAHFRVGQPVEVSAQDSIVLVRAIGTPKLTLARKLSAFDPALHGDSARRKGGSLVPARKSWCPDRRDMIWINCNPQAGREMKDVHLLVVLSPKEFNDRTGIVIGLPTTAASFNDTNPFATPIRLR